MGAPYIYDISRLRVKENVKGRNYSSDLNVGVHILEAMCRKFVK